MLGLCPSDLTANTTYSFGSAVNSSLDSNAPVYTAGVWTEVTNNGTEQIDCMVALANIGHTCGSPGPGSSVNIGIPNAPGNTAILPTGTATYLEVDGDPTWGAPVWTDMTGLTIGDDYLLSFYQASNEENGNNKAYNDSWDVYIIPGASSGPYICPVCSTPINPDPSDLVLTSQVMANPGATSTPWELETVRFTATSTSEILEFVTDAVAVTAGAFAPPFLDLAGVSTAEAPEPGTWALTILGAGAAFAAARLRKR